MTYDAGSYAPQIWDRSKAMTPVITLILNMSSKQWKTNRSVRDCFKSYPKEIQNHLPSYPIKVIDVADIPEEDLPLLKSDFRLVVMFLKMVKAHKENKKLHIKKELWIQPEHRYEMEDLLMSIFYGEGVDKSEYKRYISGREVPDNMDEYFQEWVNMNQEIGFKKGEEHGIKQGIEEGRAEGREEGRVEGRETGLLASIRSVCANLNVSSDKAMDILSIPADQRKKFKDKLEAGL